MKFKIAILFCKLANYKIFQPIVIAYLKHQGFEV